MIVNFSGSNWRTGGGDVLETFLAPYRKKSQPNFYSVEILNLNFRVTSQYKQWKAKETWAEDKNLVYVPECPYQNKADKVKTRK